MLLYSELLQKEGFAHAFPSRSATDPELYALLGTDRIVQVTQVHGGRVVEAQAASAAEADGIVARAGAAGAIAVGVRVADCVPVLLANTRTGDVAAVHAGWRGVVAEVVPAAVEALGGGPLVAALGPCIGPCCFQVGRDVADRIVNACDGTSPAFQARLERDARVKLTLPRIVIHQAGDKAYVDLRAGVRAQLLALGLTLTHIDDVRGCTKHESTRFHSYRRDGADSGRMLAAIALRR